MDDSMRIDEEVEPSSVLRERTFIYDKYTKTHPNTQQVLFWMGQTVKQLEAHMLKLLAAEIDVDDKQALLLIQRLSLLANQLRARRRAIRT